MTRHQGTDLEYGVGGIDWTFYEDAPRKPQPPLSVMRREIMARLLPRLPMWLRKARWWFWCVVDAIPCWIKYAREPLYPPEHMDRMGIRLGWRVAWAIHGPNWSLDIPLFRAERYREAR